MLRERGLDILKLKLIAFTGIVLLNIAWCGVITNSLTWLRFMLSFIGAPAIPILALVTSESIKHTRSLLMYMIRLLVLSVLCGFPYYFLYHNINAGDAVFREYLSGPFTVFFVTGILVAYDRLPYKWLKNSSVFLFVALSVIFGLEYAPVSIIIAYFIHLYSSDVKRKYRNFNIILFGVAIGVIGGFLYFYTHGKSSVPNIDLLQLVSLSGSIFAVPLLNLYNGKDNIFTAKASRFIAKYAFYLAYLALISGLAIFKNFVILANAG